jgi:solute carrier family 25 phosphate transporter 3
MSYFLKCVMGGALACGLTHTLITPLDLVKCKRQVNPTLYKSLGQGLSNIWAEGGIRGISLGWAPTFIGYNLQGMGKFGFYEMFKHLYKNMAGDKAEEYKVYGWILSSACAEVIADAFLCPWEALKVRMQTSKPGTFPVKMVPGFNQIRADEGINGFYKGLGPLWARQVPYTIVKFVFFEKTVRWFYSNIFTAKKRSEYSKSTQLSVTFMSGYVAGVLCAVISHPADTMVSKLNNTAGGGSLASNMSKIYGEIGFAGLWRGLMTRIIMIGTLTGLQWWIYDTFKTVMGLQTSGGK